MTEWLSGLSYEAIAAIGGTVAVIVVASIKKDKATGKAWLVALLKRLFGVGAVIVCVLGLSGCHGFESGLWGWDQKANPGTRLQARQTATGASFDIGTNANTTASLDKIRLKKPDGTEFEAEGGRFGQSASEVRAQDVEQLKATGGIAQIHWQGFNAGLQTATALFAPFLSKIAARTDVDAELRQEAIGLLRQQIVPAFTGIAPATSSDELDKLLAQIQTLQDQLDAMREPTTQPVE